MPKNYCIMQIWAESGKSALPICNYSQILYQFLTFTQNLKRSLCIDRREDYMQFVPYDLPEQFTAKDFAKHAKIPVRLAQTVLLILTDLEIVVRVGKQGKSYLYEVNE